ncbi:hypothetical protein SmJEL517_g04022 [Synchytrium microbalum]|uniref:Uncharacterized protein n=1 Tax=Synchytrium microbalum TaxID=1806994 RepID=A0A507C015_9FUNG|nr:uncharacterized protein SmJEL517_g04022 [Synchytrium microbalum]TPX33032.1 hypothetical protein SmJEL517_g04022 [Synchytrium microbalum]
MDSIDVLVTALLNSKTSQLAIHTRKQLYEPHSSSSTPSHRSQLDQRRTRRERDRRNPAMLELWTQDSGIDDDSVLVPYVKDSTEIIGNVNYISLRGIQNRQWAQETVKMGVNFARESDYKNAMKAYDRALEIDSECTEALVARGAGFANQNEFARAITDFESALRLNPSDGNAHKYLNATQQKLVEANKEREDVLSGDFLMDVNYRPTNKFALASVAAPATSVATPTSTHSGIERRASLPHGANTTSDSESHTTSKKKSKKHKRRYSDDSDSDDGGRSKKSSKKEKKDKEKHRRERSR